MPAHLEIEAQTTIPEQTIDGAKVAAIKIEDNVEVWIELWIIFGSWNDNNFSEYHNPLTGEAIPPLYIKLELGSHPLAPGSALRRCPTCGRWYQLETHCADCAGQELAPYDGLIRAMYAETGETRPRPCLKAGIYSFLKSEIVPDPDTGELRPLLNLETWT